MARIIGKEPEYVKKLTCKRCASIIEYTPKDVIKEKYFDRFYIICPNIACRSEVEAESFDLEGEEDGD